MKELIKDYTWNAGSKTVTFTAMSAPSIEAVLLITNVKDNVIIFNFADPAKNGTIAGNVLTLTYDTTLMDSSDPLEIWYWLSDPKVLVRADSSDSTITYIGKAESGSPTSGAVWQIKRIVKSGVDVDVTMAGGTTNYNKVFDDRESLSYS